MEDVAVDPKITPLIEAMCDNVECVIVINGHLTKWQSTSPNGHLTKWQSTSPNARSSLHRRSLITLEGEELETVDKFCFLGRIVPSIEKYVSRRITLTSAAFGRLRNGIFFQQKQLNKTESQMTWNPYSANINQWCESLDTTITGYTIS